MHIFIFLKNNISTIYSCGVPKNISICVVYSSVSATIKHYNVTKIYIMQ